MLPVANVHQSIGSTITGYARPDDLHAKLLIELVDELCEPLAVLFNETMRRGKIPADWKLAFISSIYKKGARSHAENYRPISLTSIICKVMESWLKFCDYLPQLLSGYLPVPVFVKESKGLLETLHVSGGQVLVTAGQVHLPAVS